MTLNQLIYFEKIAETESVGLAASVLHISQPSLSISLSNLEKELNVTLFNRIGRKLFLTQNGEQFLIHTKKILAEVRDAKNHMQFISADKEKQIRIGCISPVLYDYLPLRIKEFQETLKNQEIKVDFITDHTSQLLPMLKDGYFDFLLCSKSEDSTIYQELIFSEPLVLLCPPGAYIPKTWEELLEQKLIGFHQRSAFHYELHSLLIKNGMQPSYIHIAPSEQSVASLVAHGYGYAICPLVKLLENMNIQIAPLPEPHEGFERGVFLTQLINRPPLGVAKRFLEYLRKHSGIQTFIL